MKKSCIFVFLSLFLCACNNQKPPVSSSSNSGPISSSSTVSSSTSKTSSSTSSSTSTSSTSSSSSTPSTPTDKTVYEFKNELTQEALDSHEFASPSFKEFPGSLTPTSSDLLTFTLSDDGTYYIVSDKEYKLNTPELVIPSEYNNLPVQEIADEAFAYKTWLTSVAIPSSIKKIGAGAFNSSGIKTVYYDAVEIEELNGRNWVFFKGDAAQSIDIYFGKDVKKIPSRLFYPLATNPNETCNVNNIYFSSESQVESIGDYAFYKLSNVTSISLPSTLKSIGKYAFYESGITEIDFRNVETIGEHAFEFSKLEHIKVDNVSSIGQNAFAYSKLVNLDLSKSKLTTIEQFAFKKCASLNAVLFNESIETIGEEAFNGSALKQVISPASLKTIGYKAFYNCTSLKDIYLNKNLKTIDDYAFYNSESLTRLYVDSTNLADFKLGNNIFTKAGSKEKLQVAFLEGVAKIPANFLFSNASEEESAVVSELVLPSSLTEVGEAAFYDLSIESIWYIGKEENYKAVKVNDQNDSLAGVKFSIVIL